MKTPTQGRTVNYNGGVFPSGKPDIYSATINSVNDDGTVNLTVFSKDGNGTTFGVNNVKESFGEGGWAWPEIQYKLVPIEEEEEQQQQQPSDVKHLTGESSLKEEGINLSDAIVPKPALVESKEPGSN